MEAATAGTVVNILGTLGKGVAADRAARFEAKQLEQQANARYAQGTRETQEITRQGEVMESDTRAAMAAMGGTTTDAGAMGQLSKIKGVTEYNALSALFDADTEATGMRTAAAGRKWEGKVAKKQAIVSALSQALGAKSSWNNPFPNRVAAPVQEGPTRPPIMGRYP